MADILSGEIKNIRDMKAHLTSGVTAGAYLFFGEEAYLKDLYVSRIRRVAVDDDMNVHIFTGKVDVRDIADIVSSVSLFGDRKLVIVKESGLFKSASVDSVLPDELDPSTAVIVFVESAVDKRLKAYKDFLKRGVVFECKRQEERDVIKLLAARASAAGRVLTPEASQCMLRGLGNDMILLMSELDKLILYTEDNGRILPEHINEVCALSLHTKIFDLNDAVAFGQTDKALNMLHALLADKESPLGILAMMSRNSVLLYETKLLLSQGAGAADIQSRLGVHPFVAKKLYEQAMKADIKVLRDMIMFARDMDEAVKTGKMQDTRALELLVVRGSQS